MPKLTATAGIDIDDGVYPATLLEIRVEDPTVNSPNQSQWLKWIFVVQDGSGDPPEMAAPSSYSFSPKSKARGWVEALLGRKLEQGEEIDTDTLCPMDCQVTIKNDMASGFARILDVMGQRRRAQGQQRAQAPQGQPAHRPAQTQRPQQQPRPAQQRPPAPQRALGVVVDDAEDDIPY
jgi:hypothetical protein